uniref:Trans-1,2-dihydrobenzene-1,2-diol dehydrogenase n=1 Tax=Xiphophorus couchianus TaxID=32473 RepID=A0A3B5M2V0_9TELE
MAIRWGLCGTGKISHDFSVARLSAIASQSSDRAKEFAKKPRIPKVYGSYEELARDPDIDELEHFKVGLLFLQAGKNVLCEKPFAMNSRQVSDLVKACWVDYFVPFQATWSRCFPVHAEVHKLLAEEAVGKVKLVKAYFVEKELGGGALLDIGVYCLQFVLMASGVLLDSGNFQHAGLAGGLCGCGYETCAFSIAAHFSNDAIISGTKGSIRSVLYSILLNACFLSLPPICIIFLSLLYHTLRFIMNMYMNFAVFLSHFLIVLLCSSVCAGLKERPRMPLVGVVFSQDRK